MMPNATNISLSLPDLYISMLGMQSNLRFGGEWNRSVVVEQQQNQLFQDQLLAYRSTGHSSVLEKRSSMHPRKMAY
jgi:hypothetical protein